MPSATARPATAAGQHARIRFPRGAARLTLRAGDTGAALHAATFTGALPRVRAGGAEVVVHYRRSGLRRPRGEVVLSRECEWDVALGGVAWLGADLSGLALRAFEIHGGASHVDLSLPAPRGVVPVTVRGGARDLVIHRPAGTAAALVVEGGARHVDFAGQSFGAVGGGLVLATAGTADAADRYEIRITGGVSGLRDVTLR